MISDAIDNDLTAVRQADAHLQAAAKLLEGCEQGELRERAKQLGKLREFLSDHLEGADFVDAILVHLLRKPTEHLNELLALGCSLEWRCLRSPHWSGIYVNADTADLAAEMAGGDLCQEPELWHVWLGSKLVWEAPQ